VQVPTITKSYGGIVLYTRARAFVRSGVALRPLLLVFDLRRYEDLAVVALPQFIVTSWLIF
jgi:hypothetical protein